MIEYDLTADIILYSEQNGGRKNLPPIRDKEYTYRPTIKFINSKYCFCCGLIIGSYISNYQFDEIIRNVKIVVLNKVEASEYLRIGNKFEIFEGLKKIGDGTIVTVHI